MKKYITSVIPVIILFSKITFAQFTPQQLYDNGLKSFYNADFQDAVNYLSDYIKQNPADINGYTYRGLTYQAMKNYQKSISDFAKVIDLTPNNSDGYLNRGNSFYFSKNLPSALQDYNDAVRVNSHCFEGYLGQSRVYLAQRKFDEALRQINMAQGVDPVNPRSYINKVFVHMQLNDTDKIFEDVLTAMYYDSNIVFSDYRRDLMFIKVVIYASALDIVNFSIQQYPDSYINYFVRSFINLLANRYSDSSNDLKKSMLLNNKPDPKYNNAVNMIYRSIDRNGRE